jgi:hypothetical protein
MQIRVMINILTLSIFSLICALEVTSFVAYFQQFHLILWIENSPYNHVLRMPHSQFFISNQKDKNIPK